MLIGQQKIQHRFLILLATATAVLLYILFLKSPGLEGGMDSYSHYLIARYSFTHPELLLHYWGKPVYNMIAAPFTQFGLKGSVLLNIISLLASAFLVFKSAKNLQIKHAYLAFVFCLFSPIFLDNTISSLTEPLNALLLSLCIFYFSKNNFLIGSLIAGFLPYARSEGFVIAAIIALYLIVIAKNYKAIGFLIIGSITFNIIGWIIEGKPFWIITENPYLKFELSGENVCGSGSFFNYLRWGHITFGFVICLLLLVDYYFNIRNNLKKQFNLSNTLIPSIFLAYFGIHSLIWGLGMMGSCGYVRVMVVIAPLAAIMAAKAADQLLLRIPEKWRWVLIFALIGNSIYTPIKYYSYKYPLQISQEQELYTELYQWYKKQDYENRTKVYMYPYFSILADIDPWNRNEHEELWFTSLDYYKKGDIIIWDGHFGPNEAGIPLDYLLEHQDYKLIHHLEPNSLVKTLNEHKFEIYVFEKLSDKKS